MARSCTPPPLSDRKRILAEAHRRQSLALPRPSFSRTAESDNDGESDIEDDVEVDGAASMDMVRGRSVKRGDGGTARSDVGESTVPGTLSRIYAKSSRAKPSTSPNVTPERTRDSTNLPTWTPLRVPDESQASEELDSPTATFLHDNERNVSPSRPKVMPSKSPYNPSKEFRFPKDVMRWLPASVLGGSRATTSSPSKPAASTSKSVSSMSAPSNPQAARLSTTSSRSRPILQGGPFVQERLESRPQRHRERTPSNFGEGWATGLAAALNRSFGVPSVKGKERARSPPEEVTSDSAESVEAEPAQEDLLSSPVVPHPPLPEDSFEDSIWVDEDDDPPPAISSPATFSHGRRTLRRPPPGGSLSSAWLRKLEDDEVFERHKAYYVGKKPRPMRRKAHTTTLAPSLEAVVAKRKHVTDPTSPSYTTNARAQAAAFNAAIAANLRDLSLTPLDPQPAARPATRGAADVFTAASANNVNVDRPATSTKAGQPVLKRRRTIASASAPTSPSRKRARKDEQSEREASEDVVEGLLDTRAADSTDREDAGGAGEWYLDCATVTWRRRASAGSRSDAGPSSAVAGGSPPRTGPGDAHSSGVPAVPKRGRGRPRKYPRGETPPKIPKPRGRPRKYPQGDTPPKQPRGRPRKHPLPLFVMHELGTAPPLVGPPKRPRGRPRKHPLPTLELESGQPETSDAMRRTTESTQEPGEVFIPYTPEVVQPTSDAATATTYSKGSFPGMNVIKFASASKRAPTVAAKFPGMGVINFRTTVTSPVAESSQQAAPSGNRTATAAVAPPTATSRDVFPHIALGATSESEGSTLVQHALPASPLHLQPQVRADEKLVVDDEKLDVDDEKMVLDDENIVVDDDDNVLDYIDLSTWGQMQEDASTEIPVQPASAGTASVAPRLASAADIAPPLPAVPSPVSPDASSPVASAFSQPPKPRLMPELLTLADIQAPPPRVPHQPQPSAEAHTQATAVPPPVAPIDPSAILEYQSFEALVASIVNFTTQPEAYRMVFAGSYAVIADSKTKVAAFARKVGTQLRLAMRSRESWKFRPTVEAQVVSGEGPDAAVTVTYACNCPNRPLVPSSWRPGVMIKAKVCGGFVSVSAQEVRGEKAYSDVKGMKVTVRLWH